MPPHIERDAGPKFYHGGATLHLPCSRATDPLPARLEALRVFLAELLGDSTFLAVYRTATAAAAAAASWDDVPPVCEAALGPRLAGAAPLVFQLLVYEEAAFSNAD